MGSLSRRTLLLRSAAGFGAFAAHGLCGRALWAADAPKPHHAAKAKRLIVLFMNGGPSQVETFDPKPALARFDGKDGLLGAAFGFKPCGKSGIEVSEIFPEVGALVDELCVIRSLHGTASEHVSACTRFFCGGSSAQASFGAWLLHGLGGLDPALPGHVFVKGRGSTQPLDHRHWGACRLPPAAQGTPVVDLARPVANIACWPYDKPQQERVLAARAELDALWRRGREDDLRLPARDETFAAAFRMQEQAPDAFDIAKEDAATRAAYGVDDPVTADYGAKCLLARRLVERGVRVVVLPCDRYVSPTDPSFRTSWDAHGKQSLIEGHPGLARMVDRPIAALLRDLRQRGLLDDTLVLWSGEMGRTVTREGDGGRNHNSAAMCAWLAGGGVRRGHVHGATDELGANAAVDRVHIDDLHVTLMHLMGLDHTRLEHRGFKPPATAQVVRGIIA